MSRALVLAAVLAAVVTAPAGAPDPATGRPVLTAARVAVPEPVEPAGHVPLPRSAGPVVRTAPAPVAAPAPAERPARRGEPWFRTPRAAMRYLTAAYNNHWDRTLAHVTTPDARRNLLAMRPYAPSLTLVRCVRLPAGDYDCEFTHTLAKTSAGHRHGHAKFRVAPAVRHGWYMTVLEDCGDGE
jgi:hypothetical protein